MHQPNQLLVLCIGVSGCGKSTLAAKLAKQLNAQFMEADDFHPAINKTHMAAGKPLTDAMREPWITLMCDHIKTLKNTGRHCVMAYSGLRRAHRERFRHLGFKVQFILLDGDEEHIARRMNARKGHFMPPALLKSQFAALDPPQNEPDIAIISIHKPISQVFAQAKELVSGLTEQER